MATSGNSVGREGDAAAQAVDGGNGADDVGFFEWLEAELATTNLMNPEGQGSNNVTPEGSNIHNPDQGSNNIIASEFDMVNDSNATAIGQVHVNGDANHISNGGSPMIGPTNFYSCDCDDDDDNDWITDVIQSRILDIQEGGR